MSKNIPIHGSMTRPSNPTVGFNELKENRLEWKGGDIYISYSTDEFTSVCPTTSQPDFNEIEISYSPNKFYLESKAMKFFLWSFRDHGVHCEYLADMLCEMVFEASEADLVKVVVKQKPRGGLGLVSKSIKKRD